VDVATKDYDKLTPLDWEVQVGSVDLTSLLVENGADVKAKDKDSCMWQRRKEKRALHTYSALPSMAPGTITADSVASRK